MDQEQILQHSPKKNLLNHNKNNFPSELQFNICKSKRKDSEYGTQITECGVKYLGQFCPERTDHLLIKTGFCNSGWCEGTKPVSFSGRNCPTCKFYRTCTCTCHTLVSEMFKLSEMPRILIDNSQYIPAKINLRLSSEERALSLSVLNINKVKPEPEVLEDLVLDERVKRVCDLYLLICAADPELNCSPSWISETLGPNTEGKLTSPGAVDAVFKRWEKYGFADIQYKPTRFTEYTDEGIKFGYSVLKEKIKQAGMR